jgi:hypothetical protein
MSKYSTDAIGEEDPGYSTDAIGEEDPCYSTDAIGEEDPVYSTDAIGEEDPNTSKWCGEEDAQYDGAATTSPFGAF